MKKIFILLIVFMQCLTINAKEVSGKIAENPPTLEYLNLTWWKNYNDDILIKHLVNLYNQNYDLKNTELKIKQSEKLVKMRFANELPQITFDGYAGRTFRSSEQRYGSLAISSYSQNNYQLPLTACYEIDIWGKNHLRTKITKENHEIVKQAQRATYISLTSDFCGNYFNLIKTDKLLEIQNKLIETQANILTKTEEKNKIGLCSIDEVLIEKKFLSFLKEEKNTLEEKREILENILKAYLVNNDDIILRKNYSEITVLKDLPKDFKTDIIKNRPDFLQEEANLKRVGYDVKIARKELLPSFVIFGQLGLNAYNFSNLFKTSTQLASAGILPVFDVFTGGRKMAYLKIKKYQYDEALNTYQKTIVEDIKELNTAINSYKIAKKNLMESKSRYGSQNQIFNNIQDRKNIGTASSLDVLYAKETNLIAEKEVVSNTIDYLISTISLYKSVGGKNLYKLDNNNL